MDREPEVIKRQMEDTRSSLTENLGALQENLTDTVETTTSAVSETVENVKDTVEAVTDAVQGTVETVKDTFNFRKHAENYPWAVFGGAVAVGFLGGYLLGGRSRKESGPSWDEMSNWASHPGAGTNGSHAAPSQETYETSDASGSSSEQGGWLWEQLGRLKGLAISTLMGAVRDVTSRALPESVGGRVAEEFNTLTSRLGGEPIRGEVLPPPEEEENQPSGRSKEEESETGRGKKGNGSRPGPPKTRAADGPWANR